MDLSIRHLTRHRYAVPARQVALRLRLWPRDLPGQRVLDWSVTVNGAPVRVLPANAFGDAEGFAVVRGPVEAVEVLAEGRVRTEERHGIVVLPGPEPPLPVFLRPTRLTAPDAGLGALAREVAGGAPLDALHRLMARVQERIAYAPDSTTTATTAAEALAQGRGVCQDQAHAFLACARLLGVPARYVAGYLLEEAPAPGETHAWVEAWVEGLGWVAFDATHRLCATERHVRLCCGLDADDASPVRGSVWGAEALGVLADVMIEDAGPGAQQQ